MNLEIFRKNISQMQEQIDNDIENKLQLEIKLTSQSVQIDA